MTSTTERSHFTDFLDDVWPTVLDTVVEGKSLADTLTIPSEENEYPRHLSDDQTEADKVLRDMIMHDVPNSVVRSVLRSDSYDILVPPNPSTAPYIAISYTEETLEEHYALFSDECSAQNSALLTVPYPGVTSGDEDDGEEEWDPDTELDAPSFTTADSDDLEDLESSADLESYFAVCDRDHNVDSTVTSLDTTPLNTTPTISDSALTPQFRTTTTTSKSAPRVEG